MEPETPQSVMGIIFQMMEILSEDSALSSASSDPHLVGASGVEYDFNGEPGSTYSLFSAPQCQLAVHLAGDGPGTHFMTQVGLLFKGEEFFFGESTMTEVSRRPRGPAHACGDALFEWSPSHAELSLCPGHTVGISQMHTSAPWLMRADGSSTTTTT